MPSSIKSHAMLKSIIAFKLVYIFRKIVRSHQMTHSFIYPFSHLLNDPYLRILSRSNTRFLIHPLIVARSHSYCRMAQEQTPTKRRDLAPILPSPFTHPNASLETPRLLLRPILEADAEDFFAIRSLPEVLQWS